MSDHVEEKKQFIFCEKCGKRLIERCSDGTYHFVFGRSVDRFGNKGKTPVDIVIHGSLTIKCLRRTCGHINVLNFFDQSDIVAKE